MSPADAQRWRRRLRILVPLAALLLALWAHQDGLREPYRVNNDAHQHTFWFHWDGEPEAIEGDLMALYASRYEPPLWVWLYRAASPLIAPIWLGKLLPLVLFPLSALLLFLVVDRIDDRPDAFPWPALAAVALFGISPFFLRKMAGGHPRAFATPFLLATLYLLQRRPAKAAQTLPLAALLLVQSVVYPISWLLSGATVAASWLRPSRTRPFLRLEKLAVIAPLLASMVLGGLLLLGRYGGEADPRLGKPFTRAQLEAEPDLARQLQRGGRTRDLPIPSLAAGYRELIRGDLFRLRPAWSSAWPKRLHARLYPLVPALLLLFALLAWRRKLPFPPELLWLTVISCLLYPLADALLLKLLLPRRYIMYSLSLVTVICLALLAGALLRALPRAGRRLSVAGLAALFLLFAPGIRNFALDDYSPFAGAFEVAGQLPPKALVAAAPHAADGIPLFTGRHVLLNFQMSLPYYPTYWRQMERRLDALFTAYYAREPEPLAALRARHGVDYLIVDRRDFERARNADLRPRDLFFEPWGSRIRQAADAEVAFHLETIPADRRLFETADGRFFAIELQ